jgi:flagellar biogenesis protein FliO
MDALWRLLWALPLVLALGAAAVLLLKRFVAPAGAPARPGRRMSACESVALSDETRVHLVEIDGKTWLVVESSRHATAQATATQVGEARATAPLAPPWVRRLYGAKLR